MAVSYATDNTLPDTSFVPRFLLCPLDAIPLPPEGSLLDGPSAQMCQSIRGEECSFAAPVRSSFCRPTNGPATDRDPVSATIEGYPARLPTSPTVSKARKIHYHPALDTS